MLTVHSILLSELEVDRLIGMYLFHLAHFSSALVYLKCDICFNASVHLKKYQLNNRACMVKLKLNLQSVDL